MTKCLIHVLVQLILFFMLFWLWLWAPWSAQFYCSISSTHQVLFVSMLRTYFTVLLCIILILWSVLFLTPKPPPFIPIKQGLLILYNPYHLILVSKADLYKIRRNIDACVGNRNGDNCLNQPKCMRTMGTRNKLILLLVFWLNWKMGTIYHHYQSVVLSYQSCPGTIVLVFSQ